MKTFQEAKLKNFWSHAKQTPPLYLYATFGVHFLIPYSRKFPLIKILIRNEYSVQIFITSNIFIQILIILKKISTQF